MYMLIMSSVRRKEVIKDWILSGVVALIASWFANQPWVSFDWAFKLITGINAFVFILYTGVLCTVKVENRNG